MTQERIQKQKISTKQEEAVEKVPKTDSKETLKDELDDLLDSIDEALGENLEHAQAYIDSFINKGGE